MCTYYDYSYIQYMVVFVEQPRVLTAGVDRPSISRLRTSVSGSLFSWVSLPYEGLGCCIRLTVTADCLLAAPTCGSDMAAIDKDHKLFDKFKCLMLPSCEAYQLTVISAEF